jgi:hypothetical protein
MWLDDDGSPMEKDSSLCGYTLEDLEREVGIRKKEIVATPLPLAERNYANLEATVAAHIHDVMNGVGKDDDEHYIYEAAMTAIYGHDIWDKLKEYWE